MKNISEIDFEEIVGKEGNLGLITLNRPKVLNALNHDMFLALDENLRNWEKNAAIKVVVIRSREGRAFCAGGDIRAIYELKKKNPGSLNHFFRDEYRLNQRIYHFSKPYIAFLNGITMGGGVGISLHGSHRVGTDKLIFAMPETTIGFYPDVGTTYYLARMPFKMGYYLGLTGERINAADCNALGIIQEMVNESDFETILDQLRDNPIRTKDDVSMLLKPFAKKTLKAEILVHKDIIQNAFSQNSIEEMLEVLESSSDEWANQTANIMRTKSPSSLKVTLKALQEAEKLSFDAAIKMEYGLTSHFIEEHDLFEGIRALVIDKDQKPHWKPSKLEEVHVNDVAHYFKPITESLV